MGGTAAHASGRDPGSALPQVSSKGIVLRSNRVADPCALALSAILVCLASATHADVKISSAATSNMTCSSGVCAPTATKAVLNVSDLENMLASGNVEVTTTGSGVQATGIQVDTPLAWSSTNTLALDAYESITVEKPVTISGLSGLSITTNDGGSGGYLAFGMKGHVTFADLSSTLTINGVAYMLEGDIKSLADAIAANSSGDYALAKSYDASGDGTYPNSPIPTEFAGSFEGLDNTISDLSLHGSGDINAPVGLFAELALNNEPGGAIENIVLVRVSIDGSGFDVGGLVGNNLGAISGSFVSGSASSNFQQGAPQIGLLVGLNGGPISRSGAEGVVTSGVSVAAGGLVGGHAGGAITQSFTNCKVSGGSMSALGGLAGGTVGFSSLISQSYAMGTAIDASGSVVGGLVGENESSIAQSYSTATLKNVGHRNPDAGGLIGIDDAPAGNITSSYWDTTTSKIGNLRHGAGTPKNDPGITGLTTEQLQSGLPKGFDPTVWAENPNINGGFPYLIANPPRR